VVGGYHKFLFTPNPIFFVAFNFKLQNPGTTPSGRKVCGTEEKERNKLGLSCAKLRSR
jgi:hypothetical protein